MQKKRIGIVTFHRAHNYGAALQAFALKTFLESHGHEAYFVDYQHRKVRKAYRLIPEIKLLKPRTTVYRLFDAWSDSIHRRCRIKAFNEFIRKHFELLELGTDHFLDLIILGSDQIWNPRYTNGLPDEHFGKFKKIKANKIISYAASCGDLNTLGSNQKVLFKNIKKLDAIGVREKNLEVLINKEMPQLKVARNLDPTLLLNKETWNSLAAKPLIKEKYILYYEVEANGRSEEILKKLSQERGLKIVRIFGRSTLSNSQKGITSASPEEFLSLVKNSSCVVTTSFHGTVFSLIFQKPFWTIKFGNHIDDRSHELLTSLSLQDRMIQCASDACLNESDLDYSVIQSLLSDYRSQSVAYLQEWLR